MGPDYQRPTLLLEPQFAFGSDDALLAAATDQWWQALADPTLNRLMARALAQNLDVQATVARIAQAEAQLRATGIKSQLSGELDATGRVQWIDDGETDTAQTRLAPVFVLDLFGEKTREREAALASRDRAAFDAAAARLALQLAMAEAYFDLRYFQELERLRNRAVRNQRGVVEAVRQREAFQADSRVTLRRTEAELQLQRALLPAAKQGQISSALRMATLLAEPFSPLLREVGEHIGQPRPGTNVDPGLPAGLLKNRPDIRAAEASLRAAVARVGVTEAQLYPTISLSGTVTVGADSTVSIGPNVSFPILNRTARLAGRDVALAQAHEAELLWRAAVREGIDEVQLNLVEVQTSDAQVDALSLAVAKFRDAAGLSREAFQLQAITHVEILDVEDRLTQSELQLIAARRAHARAWARLNVAIGQGWLADYGVGGPSPKT